MTRVLMAFRADAVAVGDFLQTEHGPMEVLRTEVVMREDYGRAIELQARTRADNPADVLTLPFHFAPDEAVCLWETRPAGPTI